MSLTDVNQLSAQAQTIWAPVFAKELREKTLLPSLVNKEYEGVIRQGGANVVRVSQVNKPLGQLTTVGTDDDAFSSDLLVTQYVDVPANKRATASFEIADSAMLLTQLGKQESEIRAALLQSVEEIINDYIYSLVAPSGSAPDNTITGVSDFNSSALGVMRVKAAESKWMKDKRWYGLLSPQYYQDLLNSTQIGSSDFGASDTPVIDGQISLRRFGFDILEDDSRTGDYGLFFHPDWVHLVMANEPTFQVSDMHALGRFTKKISVTVLFGAILGIDGSKKHATTVG